MKKGWLLLVLLLAACASPPVTWYRLDVDVPMATTAQPGAATIQLAPIKLPVWLDRPQIVLADGENRLQILDQSRWAAPLPVLLADNLARGIGHALGISSITAWPSADAYPASMIVLLDITVLQGRLGQGVHLEASWRILHKGQVVATDQLRTDAVQTATGVEGLVAAHDAVLARLAMAIAASLNATVPAQQGAGSVVRGAGLP